MASDAAKHRRLRVAGGRRGADLLAAASALRIAGVDRPVRDPRAAN